MARSLVALGEGWTLELTLNTLLFSFSSCKYTKYALISLFIACFTYPANYLQLWRAMVVSFMQIQNKTKKKTGMLALNLLGCPERMFLLWCGFSLFDTQQPSFQVILNSLGTCYYISSGRWKIRELWKAHYFLKSCSQSGTHHFHSHPTWLHVQET